jgi:hypothetical protein
MVHAASTSRSSAGTTQTPRTTDASTSRSAKRKKNSDLTEIVRWYRELQYYGFIVQMKPGYLGLEGKGRAPLWRLT